MNYAERHNIEKGDIVEVITVDAFNESRTRIMRYEGAFKDESGTLRHWFLAGGQRYRLMEKNIRSLRKRTREQAAQSYYVGQDVHVFKYGSPYFGTVTKVGRTRITVRFTTRGGKIKEQAVPVEGVVSYR